DSSAFVKLTEGCSNHCSFCAIPLIRGELRSRRADDILTEIRTLVSQGIVELNLIGQDVAAYGTGAEDDVFGTGRFPLPDSAVDGTACAAPARSALSLLLERISAIPGDFIVRLLYIHPDHFNRDILPVIQREPRILHYFDIPFQSGDDRIIRAMNRRGSAAAYQALVQDIRAALPDAVIRTTFLTGFPGETEDEAERSRAFLSAIRSDWSGCFPYSREEDTPAYSLKKRVPAAPAKRRAEALRRIQSEITRSRLAGFVGNEYDILIEEVVAGADGLAIGRAWFQAPDVDGSVVVRYDRDDARQEAAVRPGRFVRAKVESAGDVDLDALFVADSPKNAAVPQSPLVFAPEQQRG
ncbi:MAG: MiaB/RimO family radical SAM methylthiotransferase, partial [Treponemataceae bacterium]|nr:MiaB/RimO family radical SAM methylthiotransferase [Treponemataceae bacterium]